MCVCVCVRERERERDRVTSQRSVQPVRNRLNRGLCVCVCVCERERETGLHHSGVYSPSEIVLIAACVQTHTSIITVSVTRLCSTFGLELMVKLTTLLTVFTLIFYGDYGKGCYISNECLWCSANHNALGQLANQSRLCLSEGGTLLKMTCLREAGHRGTTIMYSIWKIMCFLNIKACQHILLHQIHKIMIFKKASYDPLFLFV